MSTALAVKPLAKAINTANGGTNFKLTVAQDRAMDVLVSRATYIALGGGSRSGKTFLLVRAVIIRAMKSPDSRQCVFRFRFNSLKASVINDTLPKVLKLCFPELPSVAEMMNKTDWFLTLPNGSEIWFAGLDDADRTEKILGMEFATTYFNEASQIPWNSFNIAVTRLAQKTANLELKCYVDFNPPSKKHWTYVYFIEKKNPEDQKPHIDQFDYAYHRINPHDNTDNLDPKYIKLLESMPLRLRKRFLYGEFADDTEGALWTAETLDQNRVLGQEGTLPDWLRIVISVDPSGCSGPEDTRSDEVGIMVQALGADGHGYLLEDLSTRRGPEGWGQIVADAYDRHGADAAIGEGNYGGDMVRAVIHAANPNIPYKQVTATRGKVVRAEPISFIYDQKKIHHVGYFPELEEQMCGMTLSGYQGIKSPDRADANIWGWTELFPKLTQSIQQQNWRTPGKVTPKRSASRFDSRSYR